MARNTLIDFLEYNNREDLVSKVAQILASDLSASIQERKNIIFSVPGGNTPGPIFDKLCEFDLDWKRVSIILNDERWVPESSERSNTKLLRERLLIKKAALATYISMYSGVLTPELVSQDPQDCSHKVNVFRVSSAGVWKDVTASVLIRAPLS